MYTAEAFAVSDRTRCYDLIEAFPFALILVVQGAKHEATHVPVILDRNEGEQGRLRFHVARENPIWLDLDGRRETVAVFTGPHAYVSPDWYESTGLVPTWNYAVVHAYGKPTVMKAEDTARQLDDLAAHMERQLAPKPPWTADKMKPDVYKRMLDGIVGLSLPIERLEAKFKLSQNRTPADRSGVMSGLRARGGELDLAVAAIMEDEG